MSLEGKIDVGTAREEMYTTHNLRVDKIIFTAITRDALKTYHKLCINLCSCF